MANCPHNIAPGRSVYATMAIFERAQRERRTRALREYLDTLRDDAERARALRDCAQDLRDVGINPDRFM